MWIHTLKWSASISIHPKRPDLFIVKFRTQQETNSFIESINHHVRLDDIDQRRSFAFGLTPGKYDYPYQLHIRREYVMVSLYYAVDQIDYTSLTQAAKNRMSNTIVSKFRHSTLVDMWFNMQSFGRKVWDKKEHALSYASTKPVHTPSKANVELTIKHPA